MSRFFAGVLTALVAVVMTLGAVQDAEAKRLGGGKSFGSRPGYSQPYQRSTPPSAASPAAGAATSRAAAQNATQRQALSNRGGLMGMLGGLALGGLLGALFFGGAFENLNLFDIAVFVGLAALAYFLFAHFRRRAAAAAPSGGGFGRLTPAGTGADEPVVRRQSGAEGLRSGGWGAAADVPQEGPVAVPEGFDTAAFLNGAKRAYRLLQEAWDRGDLSELRGLTTDDVFAELQDQLRIRHGENRTEVLSLEAHLLEARQAGNEMEASVMFDAFLREVDDGNAPEQRGQQVREVWHFIRPTASRQPTWFLDGIQQIT